MHILRLLPPTRKPAASSVSRFTLVELALILTVLLALASIIVPVVYRGSRQAQTVLCSNNLTQLGTWASMYSYNNEGYLPAYEDGWIAIISAQAKEPVDQSAPPQGPFQCPSQPPGEPTGPDSASWRGSHYGINQHIASSLTRIDGQPLPIWTRISTRSIKDLTSKVFMADSAGSNYFGLSDKDPTVAGISRFGRTDADALPPTPAQPFPYHRHLDGMTNLLMLDGQVETKNSWPGLTTGPGTYGYRTWHGEHAYPGSGREVASEESN